MRTFLMVTLVGAALVARSARAEDADLTAAQQKLREVRDALKAAPSGYNGHKARAVNHIDEALTELNDAKKVDTHKDAKTEHKVNELEKRDEHIQKRVDQLKDKED
jgi:hypothetical protein